MGPALMLASTGHPSNYGHLSHYGFELRNRRMQTNHRGVKQQILDAGVRLLYGQGIASLTQPRIAKEAGLRQSHLTYYFPTRNALIIAIAEFSIELLLAELQVPDENRSAADRMADQVLNSPQLRVMHGLLVAADTDPELRASLTDFISRMRERISLLLQHQNLPHSPVLVLIFHATLVGLGMMNLARQTPHSEAELREGLATLIKLYATLEQKGLTL